ncbi:MAG TPA: cupin domain-containing protein [Thermomicrobiales bacterium]|nr:cupin domain-containing protein [Thermomicrobiales bacterium]
MTNQFAPGIESFVVPDDGVFPNSTLPVVLYRQAIALARNDPAASIEERFHDEGWEGVWRNGIFTFHHYHSTAHEVLGIARGTVRVQLGGPTGPELELTPGDIVVLPAGTSHFNAGQSGDLIVVGGYPSGQRPDLLRGEPGDRPAADDAIAAVPRPQSDPVLGDRGPLIELWAK